MTIDQLIIKVRDCLDGIDRTQDDSRGGYWQTADGAKAGRIILGALERMLRANWPNPAALARQGWAPVGTGPSIEDLGPLIVWLTDMAIQAANAGRSDEAGMLTWASLVLGERVNEDATDHVANVSNMVESAPDTVYLRALQPTTMQPIKTSDDIPPGPFSEHELREQWNQQADEHNQWGSLESSEQLAWAQVRAIASDRKAALPTNDSAADLLAQRHPAPVPVSERLPEKHDLDAQGRCWWYRVDEDGVGDWFQRAPYHSVALFTFFRLTHWLPAHALPLPAGEGK